ncbi:MAG: hypothetical protein Ct9H300mP26_3060 [Acidimicrobiales bacterium]|nr:MAG: hypothetical protein Ct9H300mP26_3060 [Acidimicrobiales bacterium]
MSSQSGPSPTIDVEVTPVEVTEVVGFRVRSPWDVVWDGSEAQPLRLMKTIAVGQQVGEGNCGTCCQAWSWVTRLLPRLSFEVTDQMAINLGVPKGGQASGTAKESSS